MFPNLESVATNFQYRVPIDDTHTMHIYYSAYPQAPEEYVPQTEVPYYDVPVPIDDAGNPIWDQLDSNGGQDAMVWIMQGAVANRPHEQLRESDKGVVMFRNLIRKQLKIVEEGGEPMNVIRDPAENQYIDVPRYEIHLDSWETARKNILRRVNGLWKYSPIARQMVEKSEGIEAQRHPDPGRCDASRPPRISSAPPSFGLS